MLACIHMKNFTHGVAKCRGTGSCEAHKKIKKNLEMGKHKIIVVMIIIKYIGKNQQYAHQVFHTNGTLPHHTQTHRRTRLTQFLSVVCPDTLNRHTERSGEVMRPTPQAEPIFSASLAVCSSFHTVNCITHYCIYQ